MANNARFETHPTMNTAAPREPTGEFYWHFRDRNGRITATGGENFTTRHDAHRAIYGSIEDFVGAAGLGEVSLAAEWRLGVPILDFDEHGDVIRPGAE